MKLLKIFISLYITFFLSSCQTYKNNFEQSYSIKEYHNCYSMVDINYNQQIIEITNESKDNIWIFLEKERGLSNREVIKSRF